MEGGRGLQLSGRSEIDLIRHPGRVTMRSISSDGRRVFTAGDVSESPGS